MNETTLHSYPETEEVEGQGQLVDVTVYRDWNGYGYKHGHIDMECKHTHVNWTQKDLDTIRTCEKVRQNVGHLLSMYLM